MARKQGVDETFDGFLLDLRTLAINCKYDNLEESIPSLEIKSFIIIWVLVILTDKVEYDKAVEMSRTHETSLMQGKHMGGESSGAIHHITYISIKINVVVMR